MPSKLSRKVAVVTGASKGLGAEIARQLASEGASVVVNYSTSRSGADKVVADITSKGGKAIAVQADVSKASDVKRLFAETKKAFGRLDVLVNNAGIYQFAPLEEITPEDFHKHFDLNVLGVILTTQEAVKLFGPDGGSIVNISSMASTESLPSCGVYAASKAAVNSLTRVFAAELGGRKIRVNTVACGPVATEAPSNSAIPTATFIKCTWQGRSSAALVNRTTSLRPSSISRRTIRSG